MGLNQLREHVVFRAPIWTDAEEHCERSDAEQQSDHVAQESLLCPDEQHPTDEYVAAS